VVENYLRPGSTGEVESYTEAQLPAARHCIKVRIVRLLFVAASTLFSTSCKFHFRSSTPLTRVASPHVFDYLCRGWSSDPSGGAHVENLWLRSRRPPTHHLLLSLLQSGPLHSMRGLHRQAFPCHPRHQSSITHGSIACHQKYLQSKGHSPQRARRRISFCAQLW
jgi:hypothetical protein